MNNRTLLAICVRIRIAALAVVEDGRVVEIYRRHFQFVPKGATREKYLARAVRRVVARHAIESIVVEPGDVAERAVRLVGRDVQKLGIAEAKRRLIGLDRNRGHADLYDYLVRRDPGLARFVQVLPNGKVAASEPERFRTINLLAAGLGLAASTS